MDKQEIIYSPKKEIIIREKRKRPGKTTYFLIAASAIVLFILLTSAKQQQIEVRTIAEEKYYVQVPVTETKEFNITEIYYEKTQYTGFSPCSMKAYNFTEDTDWTYEQINDSLYFVCRLTVTNLESKPGEWGYFAFIKAMQDSTEFEYLDQRKTIEANSTETFIWLHLVQDVSQEFICSAKRLEVPQLNRCEKAGTYSLVPKTRIVTTTQNTTRLVPVEQKRNITTVKNETGYVNRFFAYVQPFYLGY